MVQQCREIKISVRFRFEAFAWELWLHLTFRAVAFVELRAPYAHVLDQRHIETRPGIPELWRAKEPEFCDR